MPPADITQFQTQALRIFAALYKSAPKSIDVEFDTATGPHADAEARATARGTIAYLHRNGWVTGNVHKALGAILGAQLSSSAFAILQKQEPSGLGGSLGQIILDAVGSPHEGVAAEALMRRLHGS
jgi:hypothetical protein